MVENFKKIASSLALLAMTQTLRQTKQLGLLTLAVLMAASSVARADAITFEATVNSPRVSIDEALQLTLTFTGVNQDLDPVSLPALDGFSAKYLGPQTSTSFVMVNGNSESHSERSFIYNLFPNKIGKFQIPPISATIAGQVYTTKPIDVEVFESPAQAQASSGASDQNQAPSAGSLKDKILIMVAVDKTNVFLNERVPLSIKLLVNGVPVRDIQFPQFDKTGIVVDDFEKPQQGSQVVNGTSYDTVEFKTNIYPSHLGDLTFGPVQIQGNIVYKTGQNNPFGQDNGFFGGDVFNNFFDSYASRPVTITSQPIQLHVSPLPQENRPPDFTGAIGQFDFQAGVSPLQVKAGDPLTLKMELKGSGNFKSLKMPVFQAPGFKSYELQIKDAGGGKTAEQVIIPALASIKEVPALHFSYFDPSIRDYKTITQGPFDILVTAPGPDQEFKAIGFADVSREPSILLANQFSFGKMFNDIREFLKKLGRSIWFWTGLGFIVVAGVSYFLWRRFQDRLENDPAFARNLRAVREARQALLPAEEYISTGKSKDLYALLSKVLRDYLANKWHQTSAALSVGEISGRLRSAGIDDTTVVQVKTLLEQCDMVCFAGGSSDQSMMQRDLSRAQELITRLEKSLK